MDKRRIHLGGELGQKFGAQYDLAVDTPAAAIRLLSVQLPGFREHLRRGHYRVVRESAAGETGLDENLLHMTLGKARDLHIIPVAAGAGGDSGVGKIIVGAALIGAAFVFAPAAPAIGPGIAGAGAMGATTGAVSGLSATAFSLGSLGAVTFADIALAGVALAATGISQALSPTPEVGNLNTLEPPAERPSFLFNGPVNTSRQGAAIPLVFGKNVRTGSLVVSSGLTTEQLL